MTGYTLISFVGTGQYNKEGEHEGYKTAEYQFPNEKIYKTSLFLDALLQAKYKPIKKIILMGTNTSNWDVLLADMRSGPDGRPEDYTELWARLSEECESENAAGITEESRDLEEALTQKIGVPVVIKYHTPEIAAATIPEIFPVYSSLVKELAEGTDILLDITHGFRSMPLLAYQALQFGLAGDSQRKVELIYGEIRQNTISPARDLSEYWRLSEISAAKNLFFRKFDGKRLAPFLHDEWAEGEILINRFSAIVECNLSLDMPRWIKDAKSALSRPLKGTESDWILLELRNFLKEGIIKKTDHRLTSDILRTFSRLLEEHGLRIQSIITLQAAMEARTVEYYGSADEIGDYDAWQDNYKEKYQKKRKELHQAALLKTLEWVRNGIAHGGYKHKKGKAFTSEEIWKALKNSKNAVHEYFEAVNPAKKNSGKSPAEGNGA